MTASRLPPWCIRCGGPCAACQPAVTVTLPVHAGVLARATLLDAADAYASAACREQLADAFRVSVERTVALEARVAELQTSNAKLCAVFDAYLGWCEGADDESRSGVLEDYAPFRDAIRALA